MAASHEDRNAQLSPGVAIKAPCRAATTAAITLSGEQVVDATACVTGDRVLVKNQTDQTTNGIYLVSTGAWTREPDFDGNRDVVKGTFVFITNGAINAGAFYECTAANPVVFGSSALTFAQGALGPIAIPISGSNVTFTQSGTPTANSVSAKLQQIISVKDAPYNAVGDGVTDDTAAFVLAAAANVPVFVPSNFVYKVTTFIRGNFYSFGYPTFTGGGGISDGSFIRRRRTADRISYNGSSPFWAFGDSFTTGQGASVASFAYINRMAQALGSTLTNYGVSGRASYEATAQLFNTPVSASAAVNRTSGIVTWMAAFNDVYRGAAAAKTLSKIKGELRAFLSAKFATFAIAGNQVATVTGVWANLAAGFASNSSRGERSLGFLGRSTVTNGSTMTQATTGDNVVVHTFATDGVSALSGSFTVAVDGTVLATYAGNGLADGISDGAYNNQITHDAVVLTGLGSGAHSVVITATVDATHPIYIDSIETMMPYSTCVPVLVAEGAFQNAAGWALGGGVWSQAAMEASTNAVNEVVEEFSCYPVAVVRINDFFNTSNGIAVDNNHPNDTGHGQIAAAFLSAISMMNLLNQPNATFTSATSPTFAKWINTFNDANNRNWVWCSSQNSYGDYVLRISNAKDGDPISAGTDIISIIAGTTKVLNALSAKVSATAPDPGAGGTISTAGVTTARVSPAAARAGVILQQGVDGQICKVVNEAAAVNTITFAVAGTSFVADGVGSVIAGLRAATFVYDGTTALWYRA